MDIFTDKLCQISDNLVPVLLSMKKLPFLSCINFNKAEQNFRAALVNLDVSSAQMDELSSIAKRIDTYNEVPVQSQQEYIKAVFNCFDQTWQFPLTVSLNISLCCYMLNIIKTPATSRNVAVSALKRILQDITAMLSSYIKHKKMDGVPKTSTIYLCFHQIKTYLPLLCSSIEKECAYVNSYACRCLMECLNRVRVETCERSNMPCSEFLDLMDSALRQLEDIGDGIDVWMANKDCITNEAKIVIDEILCHAMSAAQVAISIENKQTIIAKAQAVLRSIEDLKEDTTTWKFTAQTAIDSLCSLERAVNVTVLQMVLEIRAGLNDPFKSLMDKCRMADNSDSRHSADLDDLIADFDSHMDRLIQIGTFAVSCSSNAKLSLQIRSCLASFESLEAELVPCATAFYLDPTRQKKQTLSLIVMHWLKEFDCFGALLDTIVDPAAYAEVVLTLLRKLYHDLDQTESDLRAMGDMVKVAKVLHRVCCNSDHYDSLLDGDDINEHTKKLNKAIEDCGRMERKLGTGRKLPHEVIMGKIGSIVDAVEGLRLSFLTKLAPESSGDSELNETAINLPPIADYYKLCPTDLEGTTRSDSDLLLMHMAKGRQLVKEAILYNTPKRSAMKRIIPVITPASSLTVKRTVTASVMRSRCFRSAKQKKLQENDQELTRLLDELTHLEGTFTPDQTTIHKRVNNFKGRQLLELFDQWDSVSNTDLISSESDGISKEGSSLDSRDVATPQREKDLQLVEEKIKSLKKLSTCGITDDDFVTVITID